MSLRLRLHVARTSQLISCNINITNINTNININKTRHFDTRVSQRRRFSNNSNNNAGKITLYGFPLSQPTRSVLMLCQEEQIPFDFVLVDALKGDNRKPDFRRINPQGLVPAIVDGASPTSSGFVLAESAAILQYLAETRGSGRFYPRATEGSLQASQRRAEVSFWLHWHHANSRLGTRRILHAHLFPKLHDDKAKAAGRKEFTRAMQFLDARLSQPGHKFLCPNMSSPNSPSLADLLIATEIDQLSVGNGAFELFDLDDSSCKAANVKRWLNDLRAALPSYDPIFEPVKAVANQMRSKAV